MARISIATGNPEIDGSYDLDLVFKNRDYLTIRRISGLRLLEIEEALAAGDIAFILAVTIIALERAGKAGPEVEAAIMDAEGGSVTFEDDAEEEATDASPPESSPRSDASPPASGDASSDAGEPSPTRLTPVPGGSPPSGTGATSDQAISQR